MGYDEVSGPVKAHARNLFMAVGLVILIFIGAVVRCYRIHRTKAELEAETKSAEQLKATNERLGSEIIERKQVEDVLRENEARLKEEMRHREEVAGEVEQRIVDLDGARQAALNVMEDAELSRKEAERERDRIEAMLKSIGDGVLVVDLKQRIVMINRAAEKITGWANEEAVGKSVDKVFDIVNEDTGEEVVSPLSEVFSGNKVVELSDHTALVRKDGSMVPIADSGAPIMGKEGKIMGAILVFRDVSEKVEAEKDRRELQSQLFQSQKMESIGVLAGGIAHDFNNLLQGILGYTSMIKSRLDSDDENYPHLSLIELAAERAADLTQQLLSFARRGKYNMVSIDPQTIIDQVIGLVQRTFDRNIRIVRTFDKGLYIVPGDRAQIHQALMNVCINAGQAMPEGGRLTVSAENLVIGDEDPLQYKDLSVGKYVVFAIQDPGVGMEQETLSRIFEPFFTTKPPGKGTGLGLAMVFGVVQNHGGSIDVVTEPGKGTTFKLIFPAQERTSTDQFQQEDWSDEEPIDVVREEREAVSEDLTILIVDDEEIVRYIAADMLNMMGYKTISVFDGCEAIETYRERSSEIDLVLLDMIMPKMGGLETFRELRKINPDVKVIVSSGYEEDERSQEIMKEGAILYLNKPFGMKKLKEAIQSVLHGPESAQAGASRPSSSSPNA